MKAITGSANLPSMGTHVREEGGNELQATLVELADLSLVGKQLHWSIVGSFCASQDVLTEVVRALEMQLGMVRTQLQH